MKKLTWDEVKKEFEKDTHAEFHCIVNNNHQEIVIPGEYRVVHITRTANKRFCYLTVKKEDSSDYVARVLLDRSIDYYYNYTEYTKELLRSIEE